MRRCRLCGETIDLCRARSDPRYVEPRALRHAEIWARAIRRPEEIALVRSLLYPGTSQ